MKTAKRTALPATKYNLGIVGRRRIFYAVSGVLLFLAIVSLFWQGLSFGIDFTGGNLWLLQFDQEVEAVQVEAVLQDHGLGGAVVQRAEARGGTAGATAFLVRTPVMDIEAREGLEADLEAALGSFAVLSSDEVSATIGNEIRRNALIALAVATLGMILYITIRFEISFAVAAVLAVLHDILIVTGIFSILQLSVDATFVAALLTIFGYSINDTIVVFDRVRENRRLYPRLPSDRLLDFSLNQTFARTLNTSLTTLMAVAMLYLFGGTSIKDFTFAILIGIVIGTYSSIAVAGSFWLEFGPRRGRRRVSTASS